MRFAVDVDVSLFKANGTEIAARPQLCESEPTLLLWLTTESGETIFPSRGTEGVYYLTRTGELLYIKSPRAKEA